MSRGHASRVMGVVSAGWLLGACGGDKSTSSGSGASEGTSTSASEATESASSGAGPTTGEAQWRRICDGSQELRLAARRLTGRFELITSIGVELGASYLYVRGDCRYWVASESRPELPGMFDRVNWQVTRTGVLTPELEQELSQSLLFDRWSERAGDYGDNDEGAANYFYSDGEASVRCGHDCSGGQDPPPELAGLNDVAAAWFESLWDAGEPMAPADPVTVDLIAPEVEGDLPVTETWTCAVPWPFDLDPASISHDGKTVIEPVATRPIHDPELAAELRALRDALFVAPVLEACDPLAGGGPLAYYLPSAPTLPLLLWIRDRVPLEAELGGITLPWPPKP
ncbi:hypothetical protein [Nannocystis punicea]|uniref:Lipoprotein n=1 Tax=Nannocystis punicea TaxID=2995304 RepID=A0ABY7H907_9BACT|nr:hypothetical protein [Nannocystis poenicansa]WAS95628.1 hypothetical protein O0S08_05650 [Nannocystis poenicansa]